MNSINVGDWIATSRGNVNNARRNFGRINSGPMDHAADGQGPSPRKSRTRYSADHGDRDLPPMRIGPVLPEEDALPGSQVDFGVADRDRERASRQDRSDMRRHVVGPFGGMTEDRITVGNEPTEVAFEVGADARVGVLADD